MLVRTVFIQLVLQHILVQGYYYYDYGYWQINEPPPLCSDYEMLIVNTQQCVRRCNIVCQEGVCFEDGDCPCANQYLGGNPDGLICAAECLPGCREAGGYCAAPDLCVCRKDKHYYFDTLSGHCRHRGARLLDPCHGRCTHGRCSYDGQCICAQGYELQATLLHGQQCMPICQHDCGPHAYCFAPNMCACRHKNHHYDRKGICTKDY
ncbi:wnt inhibitory factor 1 [Drosophila obscura]|uniref:wnt inhibitory factor 1 n=1 Tax=Drosophila obscura TaxID=7282 RepID=UPI001BB11F3A|nr:wnt inhibitory factor 1 [Drosophila obscura]XP_022224540.2 wnt inhibitory factor 1 [Drosophila obscura]